ncbi:mechanosensitive ion channel family protein [Pseudomonas marincola]|uniref:mechanosensitive ion channel family protein n=1 Tax=Pseudomonas marincola TaxID=437900 RepID=UPI0008E24743|nr:mechanosensitive ion channel family protein [Pseudomonas marincola]SFT53417.1 Mechanosensitive ion channel [Pseudomonas marincola]
MRNLLQVLLFACLSVMTLSVSWAQDETPTNNTSGTINPNAEPADLKIANRTIFTFRAELLGETPQLRQRRAVAAINEALDEYTDLPVSIDQVQKSYVILMGSNRAFFVTPGDVDPVTPLSTQETAKAAAAKLERVISETQESRDLNFMFKAVGYSAAATVIYILLLNGIALLRNKLLDQLPKLLQRHNMSLKVGQTQLIDTRQLYPLISRIFWALRWLLILLLTYQWISFVLSCFPYTRPWGESLNAYLLDIAGYIVHGVIGAIPGLGIALCIFMLARATTHFTKRLLTRMATAGRSFTWLNFETLSPTTKLTSLAVWLFALAMAYPYLPGAGTEAFKGLSVLVGLMISLGASSVVGQAAAGLILTYSHTFRVGEYVRFGDHEGTVSEMGMFTTRIRTGLGEVLTIPNSMITGGVTKNYSRAVDGKGYIVDTVVTIGYDTPWRQVEAMLLEAASRTPGISSVPGAVVFQTALSDFYPEYRLVAHAMPSQPRPRAELLSALHANIQDVFNEYGVQIMSPHYLGDPAQEKWVPKEKWYQQPAKPEEEV